MVGDRERLLDERQGAADARERIAEERDATADERDRLTDLREAAADERDFRSDVRAAAADERHRLADQRDHIADHRDTSDRAREDRHRKTCADLADLADRMAGDADAFADFLERRAADGDAERRLHIAAVEREIARIHRRNAVRLRTADGAFLHSELEHLPRLAGPEPPGEG
jgi:hypothetical protein